MDPTAEIEEDQKIRWEEVLYFENLCRNLPESERNKMRRAMVVMLYSHFEGFTQFAFNIYIRAIDESELKCCEVQPVIATAALKDIFKAFRSPDTAQNFLPEEIKKLSELRALAIERTFVERAREFEQRKVAIPEGYVDMESNLKPDVLRKNLFRLGLPHGLFDSLAASINKLLMFRNNIAHGSMVAGIDELDYKELSDAVDTIMTEIKRTLLEAIAAKAFIASPPPSPLPSIVAGLPSASTSS